MRRLMWFTLGFGAAVAAVAYLLFEAWTVWIAAALLIVFAGLLLFRQKIRPEILIVLAGLTLGLFYNAAYNRIFLEAARDVDGRNMWASITATDYSFDTGYGQAVDGKIRLYNKNIRIRLFCDSNADIQPGDVLSVRVSMRYTAGGESEKTTYHRGEGIFLLAYGETEPLVVEKTDFSLRYIPAYIRKGVSNRIAELFPKDTAGFAMALLLGDDSRVSFQDNIGFQKSGIRHVIAVSGLHVSILFSVVYIAMGKKRWLTLLAGIPMLFLFAAVAGFSPSVIRACIMQGLFILAMALDREYDPGTALSAACLVMLVGNPMTITSVSFQLSVGCMIGIFLFSQPIRDYFHRWVSFQGKHKSLKRKVYSWLTGSVAVSISAMIFTLPLCAIYFGMVCAVGIITNLLVLWIIAAVFYGVALACLLSLIWLPLGEIAAWLISWAIRYVLGVSNLLSKVPGGIAYSNSPYTILWIALTIGLILLFFLGKKKFPALLASSVALLYVLSLTATWAEPRMDGFRMTAVDVGQGQCILLQSKNQAYLVDCGGADPERTAEAALKAMGAQGIRKLDGLILTHYDEDHSNGAEYLISVMNVEALYLPDTEPLSDIRYGLCKQDVPVRWIRENTDLPCGTGEILLIPAKNITENNESSMCILFQAENCDILITGDRNTEGEISLLEENSIGKVDVLVVGHHGADTSTGAEFLRAIQPDIAVISVGKDNYYGQPHSSTLHRLNWYGCQIRRTDLEGTIIIRG